ncbi:Phage integrase family protein [Cupriavidus sp. YR651]|uniref:tyrosine-type recombinase/integrase n=1 Tax=Cupriavidus sp. YR651 TaxID=1855315 RepID=UPI000884C7A5|nr:site-specific integrase [Cupriavidus sp. YR651]SDC53794.1 Phage integrase family protein [Cupriavidus sp. YR651]
MSEVSDFLEGEVVLFTHEGGEGELKPGHPSFFIETENAAHILEEITLFLARHFVYAGSTPSRHTWAAAAQALRTWLQFLQAIGRFWRDATAQDRIDYREAYKIAYSPRTGEQYDAGTISSRMSIIRELYVYGRSSGWYDGDIGENVELVPEQTGKRGKGRLTGQKDRDLPKARKSSVIHPISPLPLQALLAFAGPRASQPGNDARSPRDRLTMDCGWAAGLRVGEIANLTTLQFLSLSPDPEALYADLPITILRKGGVKKIVAMPTWLVMDILAYIEGERAASLRAAEVSARNAPITLFLTHPDSNRAGRRLSISRMQGMFEEACLATGLVKHFKFRDENGETTQRMRARHCIHDLRHTYAVYTYHAEVLNGNSEPWKKIQAQLGHENLETTIQIYLAYVEIFSKKPGLINVRKMLGV